VGVQGRIALLGAGLAFVAAVTGCGPTPKLIGYPPGALPVEYEPATTYSACLVASVSMAANYAEGRPRFTVPEVLEDLKKEGADETKVQDLKKYLARKGLDVWALAGQMDEKPPTGLGFWLREKQYPPVCVINRIGGSSDYNHAVVVIGLRENRAMESADRIHYLDPSADKPLYTCSLDAFEEMWARCGHAMLVVTKGPVE
jgi:hypothetical protein